MDHIIIAESPNLSVFIANKIFPLDKKEPKEKELQDLEKEKDENEVFKAHGSRWQASNHNSISGIYNFGTAKKGHFSVVVYSDGEGQKFSIALRYVADPPFMKLLDAAEQEFGFNQKGVLVLPCEAIELKRILS